MWHVEWQDNVISLQRDTIKTAKSLAISQKTHHFNNGRQKIISCLLWLGSYNYNLAAAIQFAKT